MTDDPIHVEHCATCGKLLNARNPEQGHLATDGRWYHAKPECAPKPAQPESARERAERIWGGIATV